MEKVGTVAVLTNGLGTGLGLCEGASPLAFENGLGTGSGLCEEKTVW